MIDRTTFETLAKERSEACVSLFMPVHGPATEIREDTIRLKNLVHEAGRRSRERGLRNSDAAELLEPLERLLENPPLREKRERGLAVFRSPGIFRTYHLPGTVEERCMVEDRFHLKPVLHLMQQDREFHLLALDLSGSKLYRCTPYSMTEIAIEGAPLSLEEALRFDDPERQIQFHTGTPPAPGRRAAIYHGQGVGVDDARHKTDIRRFFTRLEKGVREELKGTRSPLVLAGVDYLHPIYAEVGSRPGLIAGKVHGNPSTGTLEELHGKALEQVESIWRRDLERAVERYRSLADTERTSSDAETILPAAQYGRVEELFAARDYELRGGFDPRTGRVAIGAEPGTDLVDLAATLTLLEGGRIHLVPADRIPAPTPLAAMFRY